MIKQIIAEIKRALMSFLFWICALISVVLAIFDLYNNQYLYGLPIDQIGTLTAFLYATALSPSGIFQICAPLMCTVPYSLSFLDDIKSSYINNVLSRIKCSKYYIVKAFSVAVVGGLFFIFVYALLIIICLIISPAPSIRIMLSPITPFTHLYQQTLLGFITVYTVHSITFGFTYNMLALGISSVLQNKYISLAIPYVLYHMGSLIAWIFPKSSVYDIVRFIPYESFNFQIFDLSTVIYRHAIILIIGIVLYVIGSYRHRVLCVDF